jgi:hypothetical protein
MKILLLHLLKNVAISNLTQFNIKANGEVMLSKRALVSIIISCSVLLGCAAPKSFIDPSIPKVSYDDIRKSSDPLKLKLIVEFQRNGEHYPKADSTLKDETERILRGTGLIIPTDVGSIGDIKVTVNNISDLGAASAKGFGVGLTFGLAGTTVMDAYELSISINANGKTVTRTAIKHALYTAIGNATLPEGVETVPTNVAFGRVLEQMLLRALQEMQKAGELSFSNLTKPTPSFFILEAKL